MLKADAIKKANELLRELDTEFPDSDGTHQKFMWKWSSDLFDLVPSYDSDGSPEYDYFCICGKNINVHQPECRGIRAKTKIIRMYLVDPHGPYASYPNMWMLCRYKPPITKFEWIETMGSEDDYSSEGTYVPCSRGPICIVIPPKAGSSDYLNATRVVIQMMRENNAKLAESIREKEIIKELPRFDKKGNMVEEPDKRSKFWHIREVIKERMRRFDPSATIGYGGKSKDFRVDKSDRSLADAGSPLQKLRAEQKREQAEEMQRELQKLT